MNREDKAKKIFEDAIVKVRHADGSGTWSAEILSFLAAKQVINDLSETAGDVPSIVRHRSELPTDPFKIAMFIRGELDAGKSKTEIAISLGRSNAYVTQHVKLLSIPEPIDTYYRRGDIRDVTILNDLISLFKKKPQKVTALLESGREITRAEIRKIRESIFLSGIDVDDSVKRGSAT